MSDLKTLEARLGYCFQQPDWLREALTHPSRSQDEEEAGRDNQRLEFLGDAVLQLVVSGALFERFEEAAEGALTQARAQMVNRRTLTQQAEDLGLGEFLLLSRGEELSGGRSKASAIADAYEALLGAVFMDGGFAAAQALVLRQFEVRFGALRVMPNLHNPKGDLQEWFQRRSKDAPVYQMEAVFGPDHDREFECSVYHRGRELARGRGKSKKQAESEAAANALKALQCMEPAVNAIVEVEQEEQGDLS